MHFVHVTRHTHSLQLHLDSASDSDWQLQLSFVARTNGCFCALLTMLAAATAANCIELTLWPHGAQWDEVIKVAK